MLNRNLIQGRMTKDPELRYTPAGQAVVSFCVACQRDAKSADGERQTDFIDCVAWRSAAEYVARNYHKGDMVVVDGRLQTRDYTDKNGNRRKSVEVSVNSIYGFARNPAEQPEQPEMVEVDDEELPF